MGSHSQGGGLSIDHLSSFMIVSSITVHPPCIGHCLAPGRGKGTHQVRRQLLRGRGCAQSSGMCSKQVEGRTDESEGWDRLLGASGTRATGTGRRSAMRARSSQEGLPAQEPCRGTAWICAWAPVGVPALPLGLCSPSRAQAAREPHGCHYPVITLRV